MVRQPAFPVAGCPSPPPSLTLHFEITTCLPYSRVSKHVYRTSRATFVVSVAHVSASAPTCCHPRRSNRDPALVEHVVHPLVLDDNSGRREALGVAALPAPEPLGCPHRTFGEADYRCSTAAALPVQHGCIATLPRGSLPRSIKFRTTSMAYQPKNGRQC